MAQAANDLTTEPEISPYVTLYSALATAGETFTKASGWIEGVAGAAGRGKVDEIIRVHLLDDLKETASLITQMIKEYENDTKVGEVQK